MVKMNLYGLMAAAIFSTIQVAGNITGDNGIEKVAVSCRSVIKEVAKCPPQPFAGGTITEPGYYCLTTNLSSTTSDPLVTIASSNVILDLDGHTLSATTVIPAVILFDQTATYSNVVIKNGFLVGPDTTDFGSYNMGINIPTTTQNIQFENLACKQFFSGINIDTGGAVNGLLVKDCIFTNNTNNGVFLNNVGHLLIQGCSMFLNSYGATLNACSNVVVQKTVLNENTMDGFFCSYSQNIVIDDCQFNDNKGASDGQFAGLHVIGCKNMHIDNSQFCGKIENSQRQQSGLLLYQSKNIRVSKSSFNENLFHGIYADSEVECLTVVGSQAHRNPDYGFFLSNAVLQGCQAHKNGLNGFYMSGRSELINCTACENGQAERDPSGQAGFFLYNANAVVFGCSSSANIVAGFDVMGGTAGLVKDSVAIGNGVCGFNSADTGSTYSYVGNIAKNNGLTPAAASDDTNYCVAKVGTAFLSAPFNQTLQSSAASDLNNITA